MYIGTIIEKVENNKTDYYISNEKGDVIISNNQQDADEIFALVGTLVNYNIAFKTRKAVVGDRVIISSIPLKELNRFLSEAKVKYALRGEIVAESNNIYTIHTDSNNYVLLKRHSFIMERLSNDIKIAVVQNIIDKQNDKKQAELNKKRSNSNKKEGKKYIKNNKDYTDNKQ